ncbi:T9SS type A sorting domain-containing protein [Hymenobacter roseosalivarius]|nr:T9SS type A sorting domain-containing protein [Hymenobacter roseosalivarius]
MLGGHIILFAICWSCQHLSCSGHPRQLHGGVGGQKNGGGTVMIQIFNLQGRSVYRQQFAPRQGKVAVKAALAPGVYLVQVRQDGKLLNQRVTVE